MPTPSVSRRFLQLPQRRVHYFRAGNGPPVVLVHSSPANARLLMKEIEHLSPYYTVFAFDTPGFGLSEPLPLTEMEVSDLADALAETLSIIEMPRCPVFGTHTGAAIALELGVRHPERVSGLVLDGVPAFTDDECARFFGDYFRKLPFDDLGSQYSATWTRFRDQSIWFPWSEREVANLNPYDLGPPHSTHLWVSMYFEAADHYTPAYRAASFYGDKAIAAATALTLPVVYTATETDMLYPHLARLPAMKQRQRIADIGSSYEAKRALITESFSQFGGDGAPPADQDEIGSIDSIGRQFVDRPQGPLHLRWRGARKAPPLLLIHDGFGSSEQLEPAIDMLSEDFFVIAPDLPGHGESAAFAKQPSVRALADELVALLGILGIDQVSVLGFGFGASVALDLAQCRPERVVRLAVAGVLLPETEERQRLIDHGTPPIAIERDGAHWYRTWLMLRDMLVYWPWFDRTTGALRRVEADFGARHLHRWTMDVMRARETYHHLIQAALAHDAATALRQCTMPIVRVRNPGSPLSAYDETLDDLCCGMPLIDLDEVAAALR